jgi:hypothetical protein
MEFFLQVSFDLSIYGSFREGRMNTDDQNAESRCVCGNVKLRFLRRTPVLHVHCLCCDCRQAREWVAIEGGPPITQPFTSVYYFENDVEELGPHALSLLYTVKLRENGRTTRLVTKCCHSVLGLDHPYYDQNVICVHADTCNLVTPHIEPLCRIFTRDWDMDKDGEMPSITAVLEETEDTWTKFRSFIKHPVSEARGIKLQDIFAQLPPTKCLELPEKVHLL